LLLLQPSFAHLRLSFSHVQQQMRVQTEYITHKLAQAAFGCVPADHGFLIASNS